jgi:hypothetical protein
LIYLILRKFLDVRFGIALAAALLFAVEPSQLFYERMVMAEAFGGMLWLGFVALALAYLRDGRTFWLPVVAFVGILAVSFRLNGTAVIVIVSSLLPLLRVWFTRSGPAIDLRKFALAAPRHCVHAGRACRLESPHRRRCRAHQAGLHRTEGLFMLGFVAPAIEQKDFRDTGCDADVLSG